MQENPERLAWTILLVSFFVFCLLGVSIPLGIRQFVITTTQSYPARLTAYGGAVLINTPNGDRQVAIEETAAPDQEILEDTTLKTESLSQAVIRLFDGSTLQIRNDSKIKILESRIPRFESSPRPATVVVEVQSGKVIAGVTQAQDRPRQFEIRTPHGLIHLEEGSYSISVTPTETEVSVRTVRPVGHATLEAEEERVDLTLGERGRIIANSPPQGPLPGERNLLVNGDFQDSLSMGWILKEKREKKEEAAGTALAEIADDGRQVVHFVRQGGNQQHAENSLLQELDLDVRDASSLQVRLDAKLIHQSLSGGGVLSSEFPLMVRLHYRDANGREHDWVRGFYYANWEGRHVEDTEQYRGILISQNLWYSFESENLMFSLVDLKPAHLIELEIKASGHDYESMASDVGIFAKE